MRALDSIPFIRIAVLLVWSVVIFSCQREAEPQAVPVSAPLDLRGLDAVANATRETRLKLPVESIALIKNIRDAAEPRVDAIPVLEKILSNEELYNYVHRYIAAQALYCIGTPEAKAILKKWMESLECDIHYSIAMMYHHEMKEEMAWGFMNEYHLNNLSDNLQVSIDTLTEIEKGKSFRIAVELKNIGDTSFMIRQKQVYEGFDLIFVSEENKASKRMPIVRSFSFVYNQIKPLPPILLEPGKSYHYSMELNVKRLKHKGDYKKKGLKKGSEIYAETNDVTFDIGKPGVFQLYAINTEQKPSSLAMERDSIFKNSIPKNMWFGRAVSKPVQIEIR